MEDLRDVGQNSLDAINKLGASDVGDLVLGIGDLIEELHDAPEDEREGKLEHLRGLFREFAHGEEYEFRDERLEPLEPEDPYAVIPGQPYNGGGYGAMSGLFSGPIVVSGAISPSMINPPQAMPPSPNSTSMPVSTSFDDDADYDDEEDEDEEDEEEVEPKPRPWWRPEIEFRWKSQTSVETPAEQLDDEDT